MSKSNRVQNRSERAAAIQAESARAERNRRLGIIVGVVVVIGVIAAALFWFSSSSSSPDSTGPAAKASVGDHSLIVGDNANAKTKVVVYEDFLCPYCREFEMSSRDFLHADAAKGKVQVEYRPFHLLQDDYSTRALNAFAAMLDKATPAQALKFHDILYDKQPYEQASDKPGNDELAQWAAKAGADESTIKKAIASVDTGWIDAADAAASKAGVTGTPTVFVNGKQLTGSSIGDIVDQLEKQIAAS